MAFAQYRVSQLSSSPLEKWQLDTWTNGAWAFLGTYSTEAAAKSALEALIPQPLAPAQFYDLAAQPVVPDPAQEVV